MANFSLSKWPDPKTIGRSLQLIWKFDKKGFLAAGSMVLISGIITFGNTYFLKKTITGLGAEKNVLKGNLDDILIYVLLFLLCGIGNSIIAVTQMYMNEKLGYRFKSFMEDLINNKVLDVPLEKLENAEIANAVARAKEGGSAYVQGIFTSTIELIGTVLNLSIFCFFIFTVNWMILLLILLINIPLAISKMIFSNKLFLLDKQQTQQKRELNYYHWIIGYLPTIKEIKTFNTRDYFLGTIAELRNGLFNETRKLNISRRSMRLINSITMNFGWAAVILWSLYFITTGKIKFFELAYLITLLPQLLRMSLVISQNIEKIDKNTRHATNVFEVFELESQESSSSTTTEKLNHETNSIKIKDVAFSYPNQDKVVLNKINIELKKGQIVALVGINGAGKSTLVKLLSRLYKPKNGEILLDGLNAENIDLNTYQKKFSIIFQDFGQYYTTIAENIRLGDIHRPYIEQEIIDAAIKSGAHSFIEKLPEGYQTKIGTQFNGVELSGGQWQRIAIARALYKNASYIILDEPTSALDASAEKEFLESFKSAIGERGALLISHKISAVKYADYIYVLDEGQIIENGTHDELIQKKGKYAWLFDIMPKTMDNEDAEHQLLKKAN